MLDTPGQFHGLRFAPMWTNRRITDLLIVVALAGTGLTLAGCGGNSAEDSGLTPAEQAQQIIEANQQMAIDEDLDAVINSLAPEYVLMRPDGTSLTRDEWIAELQKEDTEYKLAGYQISNVQAQRDLEAGVIVASYDMALDVIRDGEEIDGKPRPFLSTFIWQDGAWKWASEAYGEPRG